MLESRYNVPYFCPKCGRDKTNFDTLAALRYHVDVFHFKNTRNMPATGFNDSTPQPPDWKSDGARNISANSAPMQLDLTFQNWSGYHRPNQTPWLNQENLNRPNVTPANEVTKSGDKGMSLDVNQTIRQLEDLRKSSEKALSSQREQLELMEERVRSKESQLERTKFEMEKAVEERITLEKECMEMRKEKRGDQETVENILKRIEEKDKAIEKKETELKKLRDFIKNASHQESEARKKLEETIENILTRAEKAEAELEQLRAKNSSQSAASNQSQQGVMSQNKDTGSRADEVRDVISGTNVASAAAFTHSADILSGVNSLPPEERQDAAVAAIDGIESQDLSPLAQQYLKNFLAYYSALRKSDLRESSRRPDGLASRQQPRSEYPSNEPIGRVHSDHVTRPHDRIGYPEVQEREFQNPLHPFDYPGEYLPRGGSERRTDDPQGFSQQPSRDDWVMRVENQELANAAPLRDGSWNPAIRNLDLDLDENTPTKITPRHKDDLEVDSKGIIWDGEQRQGKYPRVDEKPMNGNLSRRPKTDPGYASGSLKDRPSGLVQPPSRLNHLGKISSRRDAEGRNEEELVAETDGRPVKGRTKFRMGDSSLERSPDFSDTLTEVTRYSDDEMGSFVVPERDGSSWLRQVGEGSTGESTEGKPVEHVDDEREEEEIFQIQKMESSREASDAKALMPVPLPRGKTTRDADTSKPGDAAAAAAISREALALVLPYVDTLSLCRAAIVCREWCDVSRNPDVWQHVTIKNAQVSSKFLITQSKWCQKVRRISLEGLQSRNRKPNENNQTYAKKTRGSLEAGFDALLSASQDSLVALSIIDCSNILTERCLWQVSCFCRLLQDLTYISDLDPAGPEVMWALGAGCRDIKYVKIPPKFPNRKPDKFNNKCVQVIGRCWPLLLSLCLGGVEVDIKGLLIIAQCCLKLEILVLDHMCEMTEEMAVSMCQQGLKGLQNLIFYHTPATPKAILHFHSACRHLKMIRVNVEIQDYFRDPEDESNRKDYEEIIDKIMKVKVAPGLEDVLQVETE